MSLTIQEEVIKIAYGKGHVPLRMDDSLATWDVIRPTYETPLADGQAAFSAACQEPYGTAPLSELVSPSDRVLVVTSDGTRPVPNRLLMPWLLEELKIAPEQVTVMLGTGTHRGNTRHTAQPNHGNEHTNQSGGYTHCARHDTPQ